MATNLPLAKSFSEHSKSERVYSHLRRQIRELKIPPGTPLRKNEIALECGVSRAPVSEAIARLAAEGLVDIFPQNGSFVSPMRSEDIHEALFIRTALEVEAVKVVAQLADAELLDRLDENIREQAAALRETELDLVRFDDLDEMFHATIIAAIRSPGTQQLLDAARALLDRPRFLALPEEDRPTDTLMEHSRIVDAIRTGDPELAGAAMRVHLKRVSKAIDAKLDQIEASDAD
jgi:DNA-binding GntR family transcriptional regulator